MPKSGAVCVPVALNTGLYWPRRGLSIHPGTVTIAFLEPIAPGLDKETFLKLLEERIEAATAELIAGALAADPSLKRARAWPILRFRSGRPYAGLTSRNRFHRTPFSGPVNTKERLRAPSMRDGTN